MTFCDLHHIAIDPTPDTLSLFINPRSVDNYLSGISSVLEEFYPQVRQNRRSRLVTRTLRGAKQRYGVPIHCKLPLSCSDLETTLASIPSPPSHDDLLFVAQLFDGFYGLLHLGELVWPDNSSLQTFEKLTLRTSVLIGSAHHSFGNTIVVQRTESADPHGAFCSYLSSWDRLFPFNSFLWLRSDGTIPTRSWFIGRLRALFPESILGHSLRSGGATSLAASGVSFDHIQAMRHWSSDSFRVYI
ncbi:hypothetical protein BDR05DRAFT_977434 [Suillus weaverae]|nr:hypothetical protein BDR05DRAFT_977434 [Suillus weaverae]